MKETKKWRTSLQRAAPLRRIDGRKSGEKRRKSARNVVVVVVVVVAVEKLSGRNWTAE